MILRPLITALFSYTTLFRSSGALLWLGRSIGVAPPSEDDYVKRVIATGGQTVQCCDSEGRVTVDGKPLDEPYIYENNPIESRSEEHTSELQSRQYIVCRLLL